MALTDRERAQVERANGTDATPVVLVHGLWLLASSWEPWRDRFEQRGYVALAPGWPGEPETVEDARAHPELVAGAGVGAVADHLAEVVRALDRPPVLVGHSFGGLLVQKLAGLGLAAATVAISPAPARGVLALPVSALRAAFPVLRNPANRHRAVMLTPEQFGYAFTNALPAQEAAQVYDTFAVPAPGRPLFEAATANVIPGTDASADARNPERGPMLVVGGEQDHTVPWAITRGAYRRQQANRDVTEVLRLPGKGHSLVVDAGWADVADPVLAFLGRHHRAAGRRRHRCDDCAPDPSL